MTPNLNESAEQSHTASIECKPQWSERLLVGFSFAVLCSMILHTVIYVR